MNASSLTFFIPCNQQIVGLFYQRIKARAERFGVVNEDMKKQQRAERLDSSYYYILMDLTFVHTPSIISDIRNMTLSFTSYPLSSQYTRKNTSFVIYIYNVLFVALY